MSLAQHVTQSEGFDYQPPTADSPSHVHHPPPSSSNGNGIAWNYGGIDSSEGLLIDNKSEWRRLSFAPAEPDLQAQVPAAPRISAYKVSNARRIVQVTTGVVACWLAAGIVFGFAALKPVLITEGVYSELCDPATETSEEEVACPEQDLRLNFFFIAASITANVSSLIAGSVLDRYGRRTCWIAAAASLAVGSLLMGLSSAIPALDVYLLGNILLALGGTFLFVSSFQLSNTFPKHSGIIIALVTGAFDASAAVFLFYRLIYDATNGAFSLHKFFFGYISIPILILLAEVLYMPARSYHSLPELEQKIEQAQDPARDVHDSDEEISDLRELQRIRSARADRRISKLDQIEEVVGNEELRDERVRTEEERQEVSGVWGVLHGSSTSKQLASPWFILILLLTISQMLRMNYFIATIRNQYTYMLDSEAEAAAINHFFDAALPIGGVAATPLIGLLLNHLSVPVVFGVLTLFIVIIGVLNCLPFVWAGYATVIVFVVFRPLYYSAISDYAVKVFGFATFGRIYGTLVCVSGVANFAQSGLDALTHGPLEGDPTPINVALGAAGSIVGIALTVFTAVQGKKFVKEEKVTSEVAEERQRLLSNAQGGYGTGVSG